MTTIKKQFRFVAALLAVLSMSAILHAANVVDAQRADVDKTAMAEYKDYNDASLVNLKYTGSAASSEINITSCTINVEAPVGTDIVAAKDFTTDTAYDTIGELCTYLNTQDNITCTLTGGKSDDASNLMFHAPLAGQSISAAGGYDVLIGTGAVVGDTGSYINRIGITPESGKRVILKYCSVTNAGTGTLLVYGKLRKYSAVDDGVTRNDTTQVLSLATANGVDETDGNVYGGPWMEFAKDEHVVISAGNATTAQISGDYLLCFWDEK